MMIDAKCKMQKKQHYIIKKVTKNEFKHQEIGHISASHLPYIYI